jgi:hypothetical protein
MARLFVAGASQYLERKEGLDVASLRAELGAIEDEVVAVGWVWDAELSHRVDSLLVLIEDGRA